MKVIKRIAVSPDSGKQLFTVTFLSTFVTCGFHKVSFITLCSCHNNNMSVVGNLRLYLSQAYHASRKIVLKPCGSTAYLGSFVWIQAAEGGSACFLLV